MSRMMTLKSMNSKCRQIETEKALDAIKMAVASVGCRLNELETQRDEAEKLIRMQLHIAETLCKAVDLHSALQRVISAIIDSTSYEAGGIYLSEQDGTIKLACYDGLLSQDYLAAVDTYSPSAPQAELLARGLPVYTCERIPELTDNFYVMEKMVGFACVPMVQNGHTIGSINLSSTEAYVPGLKVRETLESISMHLVDAIERIRIRQAWKEQALQFRILAECTSEAVAILNQEVTIRANKAFADMMGLSESELIGLKLDEMLGPEDVAGIKDLVSKESGHLKASFITRNGLSPLYCVSVRNLHRLNGYENCVVLVAHEWKKRRQEP